MPQPWAVLAALASWVHSDSSEVLFACLLHDSAQGCLCRCPAEALRSCNATGLDSFAALNVMEHMSSLANLGHTVIASIHQPRSAIWDMFDKVRPRATVLLNGLRTAAMLNSPSLGMCRASVQGW